MTNEEFQQSVLDKLVSLEKGQQELREDVSFLKENVLTLKEDVSKLPTREELNQIVSDQQKDIISILELSNSKVERVEAKIDILNKRNLEHETDIQLLKKVK